MPRAQNFHLATIFERSIYAEESQKQKEDRRRRQSLERQLQETLGMSFECTMAVRERRSGSLEKSIHSFAAEDSRRRSGLFTLDTQARSEVRNQLSALSLSPPSAITSELPVCPSTPRLERVITVDATSALENTIHGQRVDIQKLETDLASTRREIQELRGQRANAEQSGQQATLFNQGAEADRWQRLAHDFADELSRKNIQVARLEQQVEEGKSREAELQHQVHESRFKQTRSEAEIEELRNAARAYVAAEPQAQTTRDVELPSEMPSGPTMARDAEMPTNCQRSILPVAPPSDATSPELRFYTGRLEEGLETITARIEDLEAQQELSQRTYRRAVIEGVEMEISRLRKTNEDLNQLLEEAKSDRDSIQQELQETRFRQTDLEQMGVTAEIERLRQKITHEKAESAQWVSQLGLERLLREERQNRSVPEEDLRKCRRRSGHGRRESRHGWDLPRGQWFKVLLP